MRTAAQTVEESRRTTIGYAATLIGITVAIILVMKWMTGDVDFCRGVFRGLINGSVSVQREIDWAHLQAVGSDVGQAYRQFRLDSDRINYRANFIRAFAQGFQRTGGTLQAFTNWRVVDRQPDVVTIAADYRAKGKTLLFKIPASGRKRLLALAWLDQPGTASTSPKEDTSCCEGAKALLQTPSATSE